MDGDRKYRQNGYQDPGHSQGRNQEERRDARPQGPRPSIDVTGPRLPRMVQATAASRCHNCAVTLQSGTDYAAHCPKCNAALHCCKQCSYFEPSTRFQCLKPVPLRISPKDTANACELFKPRVTVARDGVAPPSSSMGSGSSHVPPPHLAEPRNASDARAAFDNLFKKSE